MGFDPVTMAATISKLKANGQIGGEGGKVSLTSIHNTSTETVDFPNKVNSMVGMEVTYTLPEDGYYFLHEPKVNRDEEYTVDIGEGDTHWFIANNTSGGVLNKRAFGIGGNVAFVCPSFLWNYSGYTNIMYLYEETSDNLGMGLTLPKGWYAVNADTFAVTPFNLADNPVVIRNFDALEITYGSENVDFIKENWFELEKVRTFTIAEKNIALGALNSGGGHGVFIADMKRMNDVSDGNNIHMSVLTVILECLLVFAVEQGTDGTFVRFSCDGGRANPPEQVTLTYSGGIKPIDGKYLPKGGVGYDESAVITYDGNGEKIDLLGVGVTFVKMRDEPLDLTKVYKVGGYSSGTPDNPFTETGVGDFEVLEVMPGLQGIVDASQAESENAIPGVLSVSPECEGFATGLYFLDCDFEIARMYTTYIEYTKTVHTIDPKYLPPDVLPRVELSEETATTLLGAGIATLNATEAAILDKMASNATPLLICAKMQGMTLVNGLMQYVLTNDTYSPMYVGILPYNYRNGSSISLEVYNIKKDGDSWSINTKRVVVTP